MFKTKWFVPILLLVIFLSGCAPDTIFLRPGLDTPAQHVVNGNQFLKWGKIDDAYREFDRAKELDPNFVKAYVGLGVVLGKKGDIEAGMHTMAIAEQMADSTEDIESVQKGFEQLNELKRSLQDSEPSN